MEAMREVSFEFSFVTEPILDAEDRRLDQLSELLPNMVISSDGDLTVVTTLVSGVDALEAGVAGAKAIELCNIRVVRTYQDLVTRQDIADRLSRTRQAVGNWVRGERRGAEPFPAPVSLVAGGVWLWADVAQWARQSGVHEDAVHYPTLDDHTRLDLLITTGIRAVAVSTFASSEIAFRSKTVRRYADESYQSKYALAS